jgi:hypothetical protein
VEKGKLTASLLGAVVVAVVVAALVFNKYRTRENRVQNGHGALYSGHQTEAGDNGSVRSLTGSLSDSASEFMDNLHSFYLNITSGSHTSPIGGSCEAGSPTEQTVTVNSSLNDQGCQRDEPPPLNTVDEDSTTVAENGPNVMQFKRDIML